MAKRDKTPKAGKAEEIFSVEDMTAMPANEFMSLIASIMSERGESYEKVIAAVANQDIQKHLESLDDYKTTCPECGGTVLRKNGKRNNIQRYRCLTIGEDGKPCNHAFTDLSGTILEKTRFTWKAWVEVVYQLINWNSVGVTQAVLAEDYYYPNADEKSIWLMRLKVMNALATLPSPTLSGTIQVDDTFLREVQKGSRKLFNPLPESFGIERVARTKEAGKVKVECGHQGNEFSAVTCAMDRSGKAVVRTLGSGALTYEAFSSFMDEHTDGISFLCSDGAPTIAKYCDIRNIPHYVYPSKYREMRKKNGYIDKPEFETKAQKRKRHKHNREITEPMWKDKTGPHMDNYPPAYSYDAFWRICGEQKLTINGINALHAAIKRRFEVGFRGVSTKYLPLYLALFEYLWNRGVIEVDEDEHARKRVVSHKEAEEILIEAVKARVNFTIKDVEEIRSKPPELGTVSKRKMGEIHKAVESAREALDEQNFVFPDDIGVEIGKTREYLAHLPEPRLFKICELVGLRQWRQQKNNRTMLIIRLVKEDGLKKAIEDERLAFSKAESGEVAEIKENRQAKHKNVKTLASDVSKIKMPACTAAAKDPTKKVYFLDTETTGTDPKKDEVLSIAIVSLDGTVLFDEMIKPRHTARWTDAEMKNGISPLDVADCPTMEAFADEIEAIVSEADYVCGWNIAFDIRMLLAAGVSVTDCDTEFVDLMMDYKNMWIKDHRGTKFPSFALEATAKRHKLSHDAHNALSDATVLIPLWRMLTGTEDDDMPF